MGTGEEKKIIGLFLFNLLREQKCSEIKIYEISSSQQTFLKAPECKRRQTFIRQKQSWEVEIGN